MLLLVGVLFSASDDKLHAQAQGALSSGSVRITGGPLEFPDRLTNAGATAAKTITITNTSATEDLHFTGPGISLVTHPPAGLVDEWLGSPGVATANYVFSFPALTPMGPGESRRISVAFDPVTAGTKYVEVHITTSDPSSPLVKVRIAGIGVLPFDPAATDPDPTQVIGMRPGAARTVSPAFLGFNGNVFFTQPESRNPWDDLKLSAAVAKLDAGTVKYPAGTYGNYWDWDIEWIDQAFPGTQMAGQARLRQFWNVDATPPDAWYPLANFAARLFQPYQIEPVFQLNVLTRGPGDAGLTHALRGLAKASAAGLPVRFVELGNKINNNDEDPATDDVYLTAIDYANMAKRWARSIKARHPKAKVAIAGNYTKQLQDNARSFEWNRLLEQALAGNKSIDAWKVHLYSGSGFNLADRNQLAEWNAFAGTEGAARMLGQPYRFLDYTFNINYWPTSQNIAVATFNSLEQRSVTNGTWAHGLPTS
jgi:hypothetical protein